MNAMIAIVFSTLSFSLCAADGLSPLANTPLPVLQSADQKQDSARATIHAQQKKELLVLEERRKKVDADYETELKKLQTAREELRAAHAKRQVDLIAKLAAIDEKFQGQLTQLRNKRNKVYTDNAAKIVELDKELQVIQEKARAQYTEEVSALLKGHDEKRKAQEANRAATAAAVEDERIATLNAYFEALASHEVTSQAETKAMNLAKSAQLNDHAVKSAALADLYNKQHADLDQERAKAVQSASDSLYTLLQVANRTVPAIVGQQGNKPRGLDDLAPGQAVGMTFTYAGVELRADDAVALALSRALSQVVTGDYAEGFTFSDAGEILFRGKTVTVALHYTVCGIKLALPPAVEKTMQQTILSALIQNLYRNPGETFDGLQFEPTTTNGESVTYRNTPRLPAVLRALLTGKKEDLLGVTQVDQQTFAMEGKSYRLKWYVVGANKELSPLSARPKAEQDAVQAKWERQLKLSLTTISVPPSVRARLATPTEANGTAAPQFAKLLIAPDHCNEYTFIQDGNGEVIVARRQDSKLVLRAYGMKSLDGMACGPQSIALIAHTIKGTDLLKIDISKNPGNDIRVADLVTNGSEVQSRDNVPALFVVHQNTVKLAIVSPDGTFRKVHAEMSAQPNGYKIWSADTGGGWITEFTIAVPFDGSSAGPDLGAEAPKRSDLNLAGGK